MKITLHFKRHFSGKFCGEEIQVHCLVARHLHIYGVPDENNEILIGLRISEWLLDDRLKLAKVLQVVKKMLKRVEDENEKASR